ncbi:MAG: hypothetical protein JSV51_02935 [Candidatus Bathyarchaeota archaeon]|nr:MAG: hypothetical protein JSV51_02935 [Candidatus Bathyarchaeota archaeon]
MAFPLSLSEISLWIAVTAIMLLITSEFLSPFSEQFGDFVIEKNRLRVVALSLGVTFVATILVQAII